MAAQSEALTIGVVHGPNLNLLGQREPEVYGTRTLQDLEGELAALAEQLGARIDCFQSNSEGALVDHLQRTSSSVDGWVVNAGAYTHTSVALRDALLATARPFVEVHLSNVWAREEFRRHSVLADRASAWLRGSGSRVICLGCGR